MGDQDAIALLDQSCDVIARLTRSFVLIVDRSMLRIFDQGVAADGDYKEPFHNLSRRSAAYVTVPVQLDPGDRFHGFID